MWKSCYVKDTTIQLKNIGLRAIGEVRLDILIPKIIGENNQSPY